MLLCLAVVICSAVLTVHPHTRLSGKQSFIHSALFIGHPNTRLSGGNHSFSCIHSPSSHQIVWQAVIHSAVSTVHPHTRLSGRQSFIQLYPQSILTPDCLAGSHSFSSIHSPSSHQIVWQAVIHSALSTVHPHTRLSGRQSFIQLYSKPAITPKHR